MDSNDFFHGLNTRQTSQLNSAFNLAENCNYPQKHTLQVALLCQRLFSELHSLHKFGELERFWLISAAIMHDIGIWSEGDHNHHKTALKMILNAKVIQFDDKERLIIGSIARYHRKAFPSNHHDHFSALTEDEKIKVTTLAAILRVADGLDVAHSARITDLQCKTGKKKITIMCFSRKLKSDLQKQAAQEKSDLMEKAFNKVVVFKFRKI
jgi:exopolyphosphatase/pppGpp-phosphohydrolase